MASVGKGDFGIARGARLATGSKQNADNVRAVWVVEWFDNYKELWKPVEGGAYLIRRNARDAAMRVRERRFVTRVRKYVAAE